MRFGELVSDAPTNTNNAHRPRGRQSCGIRRNVGSGGRAAERQSGRTGCLDDRRSTEDARGVTPMAESDPPANKQSGSRPAPLWDPTPLNARTVDTCVRAAWLL